MSEERTRSFDTARSEKGRGRPSSKQGGGGIVEFVVIMLLAFLLVFGFVRPFVVEAFRIPSESMVPTLLIGDRVLANKFIFRFTDPDRGDVVVFESVEDAGFGVEDPGVFGRVRETLGIDPNAPPDLIKRVVAVEGDEVAVRNGTVLVNGEEQAEPFVNGDLPDNSFFEPTVVPEDHVFVMGDNRANSQDSRFFGPVPEENLEGGAFMRFWPPGRIGGL